MESFKQQAFETLSSIKDSVNIFSPATIAIAVAGLSVTLLFLYQLALPKPIPGIPYIKSSAGQILGDLPAVAAHIKQSEGTYITYLGEVLKKLDTPIAQVFVWPLGKPMVIIGDFPETRDFLLHREGEFERAVTLADLVKGILPKHHIHLPTSNEWKSQRLLIRDLMTPSFLHGVASPVLHSSAERLVALWRTKARLAQGRPFQADKDVYNFALDAVTAFAFGKNFEHSAVGPGLDQLNSLSAAEVKALQTTNSKDSVVPFPPSPLDELLASTIELTETVMQLHGNPFPRLAWAWIMSRPHIKKAWKVKEDYIHKELNTSIAKMSSGNVEAQSAVDHMVEREKSLSEKAGRTPEFFSRPMIDEIFGFVYAGHETTSTTLCWVMKYLADNAEAQSSLRKSLHTVHTNARAEGRSPTAHEITSTQIPWLEATIEEMSRCAGTAPGVDREATRDTQILGFHIPKGTIVSAPSLGPSLTSTPFNVPESQRSPTSRAARNKNEGSSGRAWGDDIGSFEPSRWLVPSKTQPGEVEFDPNAGPQIAFGLGTRACWGKRLVYVESRILLTLLVWNFEFLPCPPEQSGYKSIMKATNEPRDCFVRLREIGSKE